MKERLRTVFYFVATALTAALLAVSATLIIQGGQDRERILRRNAEPR